MQQEDLPPFHHWKLRLWTGIFMIFLSLLGLVITEIFHEDGWFFWQILSLSFAIISLGLHFFLRRHESIRYVATIWHEILHWSGLLLAVLILSIMVNIGILGRFVSSIAAMLLLALSTYTAGIYMDATLLFVGIVLGLFVLGLSMISVYLYPALLVIVPVGCIALGIYLKRKHTQHKDTIKG